MAKRTAAPKDDEAEVQNEQAADAGMPDEAEAQSDPKPKTQPGGKLAFGVAEKLELPKAVAQFLERHAASRGAKSCDVRDYNPVSHKAVVFMDGVPMKIDVP